MYGRQHEHGHPGHEREGIVHPPRERYPIIDPQVLGQSFEFLPQGSFAQDDEAGGALPYQTGESPDKRGKVLLVGHASSPKDHRNAAILKPGMVRRFRHFGVDVRRDHGVVDGSDAVPRNPGRGRHVGGNPVGHADEVRRVAGKTALSALVSMAANQVVHDRCDRRRS